MRWVRRWAMAVHEGRLDDVLADHAPDILMFDVPPPEDGGLRREGDRWVVADEHHSFPWRGQE